MEKKIKKEKRKEKKAASQCKDNAGILELKQTERDPAISVWNSVAEKEKGDKGWAAQSRRRNRGLRFKGRVCWNRWLATN